MRLNFLRRNVFTTKCPYGETSHGEVPHGENSHGEMSGHGKKQPYALFGALHQLLVSFYPTLTVKTMRSLTQITAASSVLIFHLFISLFLHFTCIWDPRKASHLTLFAHSIVVRKHFYKNMRKLIPIKINFMIGEAVLVITRRKLVLSRAFSIIRKFNFSIKIGIMVSLENKAVLGMVWSCSNCSNNLLVCPETLC